MVIDQFVRQTERDPASGSLSSDRSGDSWSSSAAIPGRQIGWMEGEGVGKYSEKEEDRSLCTTCKRVPSIVDVFQK